MSIQQSGEPAQQRANRGLARIDGNVVVVENGATLSEVLNALAPIAKRPVLADREVVPKLSQTTLTLSEPLRTPAPRAGELLDSLLISHGIYFIEPLAADLPWRVVDAKGNDRQSLRTTAKQIAVEDVDAYATRAQMVCTTVPLKHVNAREISASLRPYFPDNNLETVTNVGNANQLLVFGAGPAVSQIVRLIRNFDRPDTDETLARRKSEAESTVALKALQAKVEALEAQVEALRNPDKAAKPQGK